MKREYYCGRINEALNGREIEVYGWVNRKRELGGITFIDLRDRTGILQAVVNPEFSDPSMVRKIGNEFVLAVRGTVVMRSNPNPDLYSGKVELKAIDISILAESRVPPFLPEKNRDVSEEVRFKYRYIDLRNSGMQRNLQLRSRVHRVTMNYLCDHGFLNLETPVLTRATPEGARDYLVPSRVFKSRMFALPQSPQLFKQLFMVAGFERYFQVVRCFRDEDLRADRQPEFTQVDIEMSFAQREELFEITEGLVTAMFRCGGIALDPPFERISYRNAMEWYGTDSPDLRIPLKIRDFSSGAGRLGSRIFEGILEGGGTVRGLAVDEKFSRKDLDGINDHIRHLGGKGVIWVRKGEKGFKASIKVDSGKLETLFKEEGLDPGSTLFLIAGDRQEVLFQLGKLRTFLWKDRLAGSSEKRMVWVVDFPLFTYNQEEERYESSHHPFTAPDPGQVGWLQKDPARVNSISYDLVLNGVEIGGGSRRIHSIDVQYQIFRILKLSEKEIRSQFGFFLDALAYGAPPHLGIALGLDRILMLLCNQSSIRDVIPFPKTTSSMCLLTGSPSPVSRSQAEELGICFQRDDE